MQTLTVEITVDQVPFFRVCQLVDVDAIGHLHPHTHASLQTWRILDIQGRTVVLVPA